MRFLRRHRGIFFCALGLLMGIASIVWSFFFGGGVNPLHNLGAQVSRPLSSFSRFVENNVSHIYGSAYRYEALVQETAQLRQEVSQLEQALRERDAALEENTRLRSLLDLSVRRPDFSFVACRVLSRSTHSFQAFLQLDQGEDADIRLSDCVISPEGALLGIVEEVGSNWSRVQLVSDPGFQLGGECAERGEIGILRGDASLLASGKLVLSNLPRDTAVSVGDTVTSFSAEGTFPAGLLVGTVSQVLLDRSGMTSYAIVTPRGEALSSQVFVISDFSGQS